MLRYHPLSLHYRRRFGCKVYKIGVSVAQSCPNREGLRGMSVCTFCDPWGSAATPEHADRPLAEQIRLGRERLRRRYKAERFLVYFQAYTNTFERVSRLRAWLDEALAQDEVAGAVVGTRPDCVTPTVARLLADYAREAYISVELGAQTLDDAQLAWLSRGHDAAATFRALERLAAHPALETCVHLMFGLPGESEAQLADTAERLSVPAVHGVKLHNLHVLAGTPLARLYAAGRFTPVSLPDYAQRVGVFLAHLSPRVAVHRLNAVASRWDEVVAPDWAREKLGPTQHILEHLARADLWQGKARGAPPPEVAVPGMPGHSAAGRTAAAGGTPWA